MLVFDHALSWYERVFVLCARAASGHSFRMTKGRNGFWSGIVHRFLGCKLFAQVIGIKRGQMHGWIKNTAIRLNVIKKS